MQNKMKENFFDKDVQNWIHENLSDKNMGELYKHWEILGWVMLNFEPNFLKKITP